jgi:glycine dehydrogenase subunit 2
MYFQLVVHGAMLVEPTETEPRRELDRFCDAVLELTGAVEARDIERFKGAPFHAPLRLLDETLAARKPRLKWTPSD